jgi:TRAP-type C4-dicarboxylate transport system permease small subunit
VSERAVAGPAQFVLAIPKVIVGGLVLLAIGVMLYGVFMRYIMLPVTDWLDVDPINFFWVEEVGETALCWLTLIGAAVGVSERTHFTLTLLSHKFTPRMHRVIHVFNSLLTAAFGVLVAWLGYKLAVLNSMLSSPALEFSLAWLYAASVVGGILIALYALYAASDPSGPEHEITDVRE